MAALSDKKLQELKKILDQKAKLFNSTSFIEHDPILIPHQFSAKADIEITGFIMSTIAWGNRQAILNTGEKLLNLMEYRPLEFVMNTSERNLLSSGFVHRTFNAEDFNYFIQRLARHYQKNNTLETMFGGAAFQGHLRDRLIHFRNFFFQEEHPARTEKHISSPLKNSACKRLNMFLRWMVRKDDKGVDFGIWNTISMRELMVPLDVHTANSARKLGLLNRKQNDWQALEELMVTLRKWRPHDPAWYDYALFGMGIESSKTK
ncbi:MAG: TIGR02757 family protein [Crocinitomicaceae bacterium]|nr:TIGR02757 family protein [Crocinitomicaceae bacterium]MBK8925905.1 TIGR02757 family protein [Crocinitomicaceae bacterium]